MFEIVDGAAALQDAVVRLSRSGGGEILVKPGMHAVEHGIRLKSNITVRGFGAAATCFYPADPVDFDEPFFSVNEGDVPYTENITLKDFSIDGMFSPEVQQYPENICRDFKKLDELGARHWRMGVYLTDEFAGTPFRNILIEDVDVLRCSNGLHILSSEGVVVRNGRYEGNGCVIQHNHNQYFRRCRNVEVSNVELIGSPNGVGLNLGNGCDGFKISNSVICGNGFRGIRFDGTESMSANIEIVNNLVYDNCAAYPGEAAMRLHSIRGFRISGNTFLDNITERDIFARHVRKGEISANRFIGRQPGNLVVEKETKVDVFDNIFTARKD